MARDANPFVNQIAEAQVRAAVDAEIKRALDSAVDEQARRIIANGRMPSLPDVLVLGGLAGKGGATSKQRGGKSPHKLILSTAPSAAKRAAAAGVHALARASQYDPSKHASIIRVAPVTVKGRVLLGADRPLTAPQRAAVARHVEAIKRHAAAVGRAKQLGQKAVGAAKDLDSAIAKIKPVIDRFLAKKGRTAVRGLSIIGAPTDPDPLHPGFLIDGSPDPAYGGDGSVPTGGWSFLPPYDVNSDPAIIPLPVRGQPLDLSSITAPWSTPPEDAVRYDWSMLPYNTVNYSTGSLNYFRGGDGFVFNRDWNGFDAYRGGQHTGSDSRGEGSGGDVEVNRRSIANGWGPLIANPTNDPRGKGGYVSQFAGMMMAQDGQWFWLSDCAPLWATKEADHQIDLANQKIAAAGAAAVNAENARIAMEQAAMVEAQAKQDAANSLAQSAADTQAAIQERQLDLQQQAIDQQAALLQVQAMASGEEMPGFEEGGRYEDGIDWGTRSDEEDELVGALNRIRPRRRR
jgi:hypothetical protein